LDRGVCGDAESRGEANPTEAAARRAPPAERPLSAEKYSAA